MAANSTSTSAMESFVLRAIFLRRTSAKPVTSATMTVTLSWPPLAIASFTSCDAQRCGSRTRASVDSISLSHTMPDRPSEQMSRRSPVSTLISYRSGWVCGSLPKARVMTERLGCERASSGVSWPASIMSAIRRCV